MILAKRPHHAQESQQLLAKLWGATASWKSSIARGLIFLSLFLTAAQATIWRVASDEYYCTTAQGQL